MTAMACCRPICRHWCSHLWKPCTVSSLWEALLPTWRSFYDLDWKDHQMCPTVPLQRVQDGQRAESQFGSIFELQLSCSGLFPLRLFWRNNPSSTPCNHWAFETLILGVHICRSPPEAFWNKSKYQYAFIHPPRPYLSPTCTKWGKIYDLKDGFSLKASYNTKHCIGRLHNVLCWLNCTIVSKSSGGRLRRNFTGMSLIVEMD